MPLADAKIKRLIHELAADSYRSGVLPDFAAIMEKVREWLTEHPPGLPIMKARTFLKRQSTDVLSSLNLMFDELRRDLGDLNEERIDLVLRTMRLVNDASIRSDALNRQLRALKNRYQALALMNPKLTGTFFSVFETFDDLSAVDLSSTTADVDIVSGSVSLPVGVGIERLPVDPPLNSPTAAGGYSATVRVRNADSEITLSRTQYRVDGSVGALFDSTRAALAVVVPTRVEGTQYDEATITLDMPLKLGLSDLDPKVRALATGVGGDEVRISRIEISPAGANHDVRLLYSVDRHNWLTFPGYGAALPSLNRKVTLNFPQVPVEFLRIEMTTREGRTNPDGDFFLFALQELGFYSVGYRDSGDLVTKTLSPLGVGSRDLSRVSLMALEELPPETDIRYFVADGADSTPAWRPILNSMRTSPDTAGQLPDAPPIVDFGTAVKSARQENRTTVTSPTLKETVEGVSFYNVAAVPTTYIPLTLKLYRGVGGWGGQSHKKEDRKRVLGNVVKFAAADDNQPLYQQETATLSPDGAVSSGTASITLPHALITDEDIPAKTSGGAHPEYPFAKIQSVKMQRATPLGGAAGALTVDTGPSGERRVTLTTTATHFSVVGDQIYLTATINGKTVAGYFEISENVSTTSVRLKDPNHLLSPQTGSVTWEATTEDWTSRVASATGSVLKVSVTGSSVAATDVFTVVFWRDLKSNEIPVSSSIVVRSPDGTVYQRGRDYTYDAASKSISRSVVTGPGSTITVNQTVLVDFDMLVRDLTPRFYYTTNVEFTGGDTPRLAAAGATFSFTKTTDEFRIVAGAKSIVVNRADSDQLEAFLKETNGQALALVVTSDPIITAAGAVDTASAFYKVINAVASGDPSGMYMLGKYFKNQRAIPVSTPATEVSYHDLKHNHHQNDHQVCSVTGGQLVINYNPITNDEFVYLSGGASSLTVHEIFEFEYLFKPAGASTVSSVLVKAELKRTRGALDRSVTPVLHEFSLRFAY
jgi:hypothetical protein